MLPSDLVARRPTLLSSCAMAATTAEARFRVDYPNAQQQVSRIVALDRDAAEIVRWLAEQEWSGSPRFLAFLASIATNGQGVSIDAALRTRGGSEVRLSNELADADVMVMVATSDEGAEAAAVIGKTCAERGIMTTGLVLAGWNAANHTVASLRPHAMVLACPHDAEDLLAILSALRV